MVGDAPVNAAPALLLTPAPNETWKVYYYAGAQMIAMRVMTSTASALYFLHADHLGGVSVVTCGSGSCGAPGAVVSKQLFYAYGEVRWSTGTMPTTIGYTGQRRDTGLGSLMFYNARYYSPYLNRWLQPDVIVPDGEKASIIPLTVSYHELPLLAQLNAENAFTLRHGHWPQLSADEKREAKINRGPLNPQQLNRYSYVLNNPLKHIDPSGHDSGGDKEVGYEEYTVINGVRVYRIWIDGNVMFVPWNDETAASLTLFFDYAREHKAVLDARAIAERDAWTNGAIFAASGTVFLGSLATDPPTGGLKIVVTIASLAVAIGSFAEFTGKLEDYLATDAALFKIKMNARTPFNSLYGYRLNP